MWRSTIALLAAASIAACSTSSTTTATTDVQTALTVLASACSAAQTALGIAQATVKGGAANTVATYGSYINAGCSTAAAAQKLAADPTSTQWLGQMIGALNMLSGAKPAA